MQMNPFSKISLTLCAASLCAFLSASEIRIPLTQIDPAHVANNTDGEASKWDALKLPKRHATAYSQTRIDDRPAIKATSRKSASGLVKFVDIDPLKYPLIEWSWWVPSPVAKGNLKKKSGDDYPARVYLTFEYDKSKLSFLDRVTYSFIKTFTDYEIPLRALNYVWANKAKTGTISPNAYTNWVQMVVVNSGNSNTRTWQMNTRNIVEDYRAAFGEDPGKITGVAIMTDSDDTKSETEAYYGDIVFRKAEN